MLSFCLNTLYFSVVAIVVIMVGVIIGMAYSVWKGKNDETKQISW
jgi:heme/copper-type cytochrome/quinol oxidase subunit 2